MAFAQHMTLSLPPHDRMQQRRTPLRHALFLGLLLVCVSAPAQAQALGVNCSVQAVELDFSEISLLQQGAQAGQGAVRVACHNAAEHPRELRVTLTDAQAQPHALALGSASQGQVMLDLFVDGQRSRRLSANPQDSQHTITFALSIAPGASAVQRVAIYPSVTLPQGPVAAGDYTRQATVRLHVEASGLAYR